MERTTRATVSASPATDPPVIDRVLAAGFSAGLLVGLAIAVLQQFTTSPLILKAEVYEAAQTANAAPAQAAALPAETQSQATAGGAAHDHASHAHDGAADHSHGDDEGWKPREGFERIAVTSLATVTASIGFALLLISAMLFHGSEINQARALCFAACGFVSGALAPAMGLAPELPGSGAGPLVARQVWWIFTAVTTAAALWLFLTSDKAAPKISAAILLFLPHIIGAPQPDGFESKAPAELASQFVATSLGLQALLWALTALSVAALWPVFAPRAAPERQSPLERVRP